jgi:TFIIF-interacting CTD phosphatase-like protein
LNFLKENKDKIEPIIYTSGVYGYTDLLLTKIDPNFEIFEHRLYQNACYLFEKKDEDIFYMIKDITRFKNVRDMRRSLLVDPNPLNFMLSPENGLPIVAYNAELHTAAQEKDEYLIGMTDIIKEIVNMPGDDIRPYLKENYGVRQVLKNAKLL